jgi:hypothetical protein
MLRKKNLVLVAYAFNPSYLEGRDQEDRGPKPAWGNNFLDTILKISSAKKRTGGEVQAVECLPSKC